MRTFAAEKILVKLSIIKFMKKITHLLWMILLALSMSMTSCVDDKDVVNPSEKDPNFKYSQYEHDKLCG